MTDRTATPDELARQAYAASIRLLARRDHSIHELTQKLLKREYDSAAIAAALEELTAANYVNDARYAELYAEQRMNQGYGPLSIRSKLASRGIDASLTRKALATLKIDWSEHATSVIRRRFTDEQACDTDQKSVARIARFLQSRGFSSADAFRALSNVRHGRT